MTPHSSAAPARRSPAKAVSDLAREWDEVAALRASHIADGSDVVYHAVLQPAIELLAEPCDLSYVLDVGCGSGFLAADLATRADTVVGVDFSSVAIDLARQMHLQPNLTFYEEAVEEYRGEKFASLVVANMSVMAFAELDLAISSIVRNLVVGGHFVFTIPHPQHWSVHCGYHDAAWFDYRAEVPVEWRYQSSCLPSAGPAVTHFHRPLGVLVTALRRFDLLVDAVFEPLPSDELQRIHGKRWRSPHFLALRCELQRSARSDCPESAERVRPYSRPPHALREVAGPR